MQIDLNCDMGESFGPWKMGFDEEMMRYISSANVAGGAHVEGGVGLYVLDLHVIVAGELAQSAELVDEFVMDFVGRDLHIPPAEAHQVLVAIVNADRNAVLFG